MSNPFSNLKNSMKKTVFKDFSFSDERKQAVKEIIRAKQTNLQLCTWEEKTVIAVLESLQHESKNGYDISIKLFQKHEFSFQSNEGQLYSLLHLLENKEILNSKWINEKKYYSLTIKGRKYLAASKQGNTKHRFSLKQLIEEESL